MVSPEVPGQQPDDPIQPPAPDWSAPPPPPVQPPPPPAQPGYQQTPPGYQPPPNFGPPQPGYQPPPPGGYAPPPPAPPVPAGYGYGQVAPGSVPPGLHVDPGSGFLIPDGTELASVGRRTGAFFLAIPLSIITLGIGYVIWGLIVWGRGQTPALQVLGMRVWRPDDQKPAGFGWMALREIVGRIVDGILSLITEIISFVLMCSRGDRRTLHDLIASTVVLYDPNKVIAR
jgi:uncharacterized RDD family membrane protein YckC